MEHTLRQLLTELRKTDTFAYFFALGINITDEDNYEYCYSEGARINFAKGLLKNDPTVIAKYNFSSCSLSAKLFILVHELAHSALHHCDMTDIRHTAAKEENENAYIWAIETSANAFAIEILGYSIVDVVTPIDKNIPVITMLDKSDIGKEPAGLHWYEIYTLIKDNKNLKQVTKSALSNDVKKSSKSSKDVITKTLKQATQLAGNKAPSSVKELEAYTDKVALPYEALIHLCKASVKKLEKSWKKPNKKGLPIKGAAKTNKIRKFLCIIDVSGSVPESLITKFLHTLLEADSDNFEINTIYYNTDVLGKPVKLEKGKEIKYPVGGGTDFQVVADYWEQHQHNFDLAINISDGYCELHKGILAKYVWLIHTQKSFSAKEPVYLLTDC